MEQKLNHIQNCPICGSENHKIWMEGKDYSNSQESFNVVECSECKFKFTNPIPTEDNIGSYYKSENYISHTDSNKGLMNRVYKRVRNSAIKSKELLIGSKSKGRNLLDIGCGTGDFLMHCSEKGWKTSGLEPDDDARKIAQNKSDNIQNIDALFTLEENQFDVITMWHVLEHVYHLNRDLEQIVKLLKKDGVLVLALPNHTSPDANHYGKFWAAWDLPIHLYHFAPNDIKRIADKFDFKLEEIIPMKWDSYYVSMLSEEHKGKNKWKGVWRGLKSNKKATNDSYSSQIYILRK